DAVDYTTPTVEAVVIDRVRFDQQLAQKALCAGVRVHRARVRDVQADSNGVTVSFGDQDLRARVVVLACGASYALQRKLGLGLPTAMLNSAQMELAADRLGPVEVHFGGDVAPGGFSWAVPVERPDGSYVRIGVMCEGEAGRYFRRMLASVA